MHDYPTPLAARRSSLAALFFVSLPVAAALASGCGDKATAEPVVQEEPGDDGSGTPAPPEVLTGTIDAAGGEIVAGGDSRLAGFRLVVPPGALTEAVEFRVQGTIDATPLPETAAAIGPQFTILPAGVAFAVPAKVTVPYDASLRNAWETPDSECRVWYRDGEVWARADQTASDPDGVTVELSATTTVGAGVLKGALSIGCRFKCTPAAPPASNCLDGDRWCLEAIGTQHVPDMFDYYSYTQGVLYWVHSPSSGNLAIAGFDVLSRKAVDTTGNVQLGGSGVPTGDVVIDNDGARWLGFRHRANVRFEVGHLATMFDAFAGSLEPRALGVVFDQSSKLPVRMRGAVVTATSGSPQSTRVTAVRGGKPFDLGLVRGAIALDGVLQVGRSLSTPPERPFLFWGTSFGTAFRSMDSTPDAFFADNTFCGNEPMRTVLAVGASPNTSSKLSQGGSAVLCRRLDNRGAVLANGGTRQSFEPDQVPSGRLAADDTGTVYLADLQRAQITRFSGDGGVTVVPLSSELPTSAEYAAMIPQSIHYDAGLDTLVVVTRGTGGVPRFWQITKLR
jgi:hypothetical protein